eukprot:4404106-Prorocentrum_lima.AAC.1
MASMTHAAKSTTLRGSSFEEACDYWHDVGAPSLEARTGSCVSATGSCASSASCRASCTACCGGAEATPS